MAYPTYTTPRSIAGAAAPSYLSATLASGYSAGQTITVGNTSGWYEVSSSGTTTTNPLGTSGVFTLVVDYGLSTEEKILCASGAISIGANSVIYVWTDGINNGRGWDGTASVAHAVGSGTNPNVFLVRTAVDDLQFNTSAATLTNNLATLSGQYVVTSGVVTAQAGYISTISGKQVTDEANIASLSGSLATLSGQYVTTSGIVTSHTGSIASISGSLNTLSGQYVATSGSLTTLSGQFVALSGSYTATSGSLNTVSGVAYSALQRSGGTISGALNITSPIIGGVTATSGQSLVWNNTQWVPATVSGGGGGITSLTGDVTATGTGAVAATLVGTTAVSGVVNTIINVNSTVTGTVANLATLSGQFVTLSGAYATTSGNLNTVSGVAYAALPGSGGTISGNLVVASGLTVSGTISGTTAVFSGGVTAQYLSVSGIPGSTSGSRFVGAISTGISGIPYGPNSGTYTVGDFVTDQAGKIWVCYSGGTPGLWTTTLYSLPIYRTYRGGVGAANNANGVSIPTTGSGLLLAPNEQTILQIGNTQGNGVTWTLPFNPSNGSINTFINSSNGYYTYLLPSGTDTINVNNTVYSGTSSPGLYIGPGAWYQFSYDAFGQGSGKGVWFAFSSNQAQYLSGNFSNVTVTGTLNAIGPTNTLSGTNNLFGTTTISGSYAFYPALSGTPTGAAGGDLTGTYPNPTLVGTTNVSGIVNTIINVNSTVTGTAASLTTLSGQYVATSGSLTTLSGQFVVLSGAYTATSGSLNTVSGVAYAALPGSGGTISGNLVVASGLTVSGNIASSGTFSLGQTSSLNIVPFGQIYAPISFGPSYALMYNNAGGYFQSTLPSVAFSTWASLTNNATLGGNFTVASNLTVSGVSTHIGNATFSGTVTIGGNSVMTSGYTAGGDLSGAYPNPTVAAIQGKSISTTQATLLSQMSNIVTHNTASNPTVTAGEFSVVPSSGVTGALTLTLPSAPANGTINYIFNQNVTYSITLAAGGTDKIQNGASSVSSLSLAFLYSTCYTVEYYNGFWYAVAGPFSGITGTGSLVYAGGPSISTPTLTQPTIAGSASFLATTNTASVLAAAVPATLANGNGPVYIYTANPTASYPILMTTYRTGSAQYSSTATLQVNNGATAYLPSSITIDGYQLAASGSTPSLPTNGQTSPTYTVTAATGNGTTVTYTCANSLTVGTIVSITGLGIATGSSLNLTSVTVASANSTQFTVTNTTVGTSSGTGTATPVRSFTTYYQGGTQWASADPSTWATYTITVINTAANNSVVFLSKTAAGAGLPITQGGTGSTTAISGFNNLAISGGTVGGNLVAASGLTVSGALTQIGNASFSGTLTVASAIINPILQGAYEVVSYSGSTVLSGTATPATLNAANSSFYFYNTAPSGSYTVAITGAPTVSGVSATFALLVNNGSTAYLPSNVTINGNQAGASSSALPLQGATNNGITTYYQGGTAWSSADANTLDSYTFTVICTSNTPTWTLLAGLTKF